LHDLCDDLGLGAQVTLAVESVPAESPLPLGPLQVRVNGRRCRLPLPFRLPHCPCAESLALVIAWGVHNNRELLLSEPRCQALAAQWSPGGRAALPPGLPEFPALLELLVRRGFRIDRARRVAGSPRGAPSEWRAEQLFEETLQGSEPRAIKVFLDGPRYLQASQEVEPAGRLDEQPLKKLLSDLPGLLFEELGLIVPQVVIGLDESLRANEFRVQLNDLRSPAVPGVADHQALVAATARDLEILGITAQPFWSPAYGREFSIIPDDAAPVGLCRQAGFAVLGPLAYVARVLASQIRQQAASLLGDDLVRYHLSLLRQVYPNLVDAALGHFGRTAFGLTGLTGVLRGLLDEAISIQDLRTILEGWLVIQDVTVLDRNAWRIVQPIAGTLCPVLSDKSVEDLDARDYLNCARLALARPLCYKYTGGTALPAYLLAGDLETRLLDAGARPFSEEEQDRLAQAVLNQVGDEPEGYPRPVLLTAQAVRSTVRGLLKKDFPQLAVLCYEEVAPRLYVQKLGQISWA
jgi:type III secretory pathway component EscV